MRRFDCAEPFSVGHVLGERTAGALVFGKSNLSIFHQMQDFLLE